MSKLDAKKFVEDYQVLGVVRLNKEWGLHNPWSDPSFEASFEDLGDDSDRIPWAQKQAAIIADQLRLLAFDNGADEVAAFLRGLELFVGDEKDMPYAIQTAFESIREFHSLDLIVVPKGPVRDTTRIVWGLSESKLVEFLTVLRNEYGWIADGKLDEYKIHFVDLKGNSFVRVGADIATASSRIQWLKSANLFAYLISLLKTEGILCSRNYWVEVTVNISDRDCGIFDRSRLRKKPSKIKGGGYNPIGMDDARKLVRRLIERDLKEMPD